MIQLSELPQAQKGEDADLNYKIYCYMETNYGMTPCDVMAMTKHHNSRGMAATGIGLAAGLGGSALLGVLLTAWGVNKASEARAAANQNSINNLAALTLAERQSRETWQNTHAPSLTQYVDVRAGAGANSLAGANALATAYALQGGGLNAAVANESYLRVIPFSSPQPCCNPCNG